MRKHIVNKKRRATLCSPPISPVPKFFILLEPSSGLSSSRVIGLLLPIYRTMLTAT